MSIVFKENVRYIGIAFIEWAAGNQLIVASEEQGQLHIQLRIRLFVDDKIYDSQDSRTFKEAWQDLIPDDDVMRKLLLHSALTSAMMGPPTVPAELLYVNGDAMAAVKVLASRPWGHVQAFVLEQSSG